MEAAVIPAVPLDSSATVFTTFENTPAQPAPLPSSNPTKSFWLNSDASANPLARVGSTGPLPDAADIVIIGSGMTGCSTAYHLADLLRRSGSQAKPVSAIILEARDFCRNGGHLTASIHDFKGRVERHGKDEALRDIELERHTVSSVLEFLDRTPNAAQEVDLVRGGRLNLLFSSKEVEAARADMAAAAEAGLDLTGVEWLEPDVTQQRFRVRLPAVFSPGNTIWPLKLVTKLFECAKGAKTPGSWFSRATSLLSRTTSPLFSLDLFTQASVDAVEPITSDGTYRWSVKTNRGAIQTRYVVHATNAYASHLLPHLTGPTTGIVPTRGQCIATRGTVKAKDWPTVCWTGNEDFEYWFSRPPKGEEDRALVILGGGNESVAQHEFNVADDSTVHPIISKTLRSFLPTLFPSDFEVGEPEMEWTGIMGFTRSRDPMVGQVYGDDDKALPGQYIAAGYSGHGMPRAFACAEAVAQMIHADMFGNSWSPPEWFPRHMLTGSKEI
ncbi:hypothetical protein FS749_005870 [Ceratobasidium sp. UAMH 11750]|nr:hypothetical protein FS749_005870 [Ceratobasidium sp. UAMH 11750]